jgi:hypothetical protein
MTETDLKREVQGTFTKDKSERSAGSLLGNGSSIIFYGARGKKLRIEALLEIFFNSPFTVSSNVMFHRTTLSLDEIKNQIYLYDNRRLGVTEQFFLACDSYHQNVRETGKMLEEIVLQYPKFKIQLVRIFGDNDEYQDTICGRMTDEKVYVDKATNWAKSWVHFKDLDSSIEDVKKTLLTSTDFFDHLSAPSASAPAVRVKHPAPDSLLIDSTSARAVDEVALKTVERIISLHLQGVDFSNQDFYTGNYSDHYKERIENHIAYLKSSIKSATNLIDDLVKIVLHFL